MNTVDSEVATRPESGKNTPGRRGTEAGLAKIGLALANWSEKWFPDPLVFAFAGVVVVFIIGLLLHEPAETGDPGRQELLDSGSLHHADGDDHHRRLRGCDHAGGIRLIQWLAKIPKTGQAALSP